jgi:hemoglobin
MSDIETRDNIETLVNKFYDKVKQDPLLALVFSHVDWPHHLPIMYNFWASMLLGEQTYQGNPFQKHIGLPIRAEHFERWLKLFTETIDENFSGTKADETKSRAQSIAGVWKFKMGFN